MSMQIIERPWGIAVHGSSSVTAEPDLVRLRFRVSRMEQTPADAFAAATSVVSRVRETLRHHGVAKVNGSRLDLRTVWSYGEPTPTLVGYQCQAGFSVESTDLDGVQQLLVDLVAAGANEVDAVVFDVVRRLELHAEAARQAVAAARAKAALYAEAAGARLGAVLHIEDVNAPAADARLLSGPAGGPSEDLAPGEITVMAIVAVGFALTRD